MLSGSPLRHPLLPENAGADGGDPADARARHRREHGDLQRHRRRAAAPVAAREHRPARHGLGDGSKYRHDARARVVPRLPRLQGTQPHLRGAGRADGGRAQPDPGERRPGPAARSSGCPPACCRCSASSRSPAGRSRADEDRPGGAAVALISESLWERSFGRDPAAVGQTLRLDDRPDGDRGDHAGRCRFRRAPDPVRRGLFARVRRPRPADAGRHLGAAAGGSAAVAPVDASDLRARPSGAGRDPRVGPKRDDGHRGRSREGVSGQRRARRPRRAALDRRLRPGPSGALHSAGSRRARAARGLRQRGQPPPRSRGRARARSRCPLLRSAPRRRASPVRPWPKRSC